MKWEGTRDDRRAWLKGQCDTIFVRMLGGELYPGQMEDADANVKELSKLGVP